MADTRIAKLFKNGASQAVSLPAEFRFEGEEVYATRDELTGDVILSIRPRGQTWVEFFDSLEADDARAETAPAETAPEAIAPAQTAPEETAPEETAPEETAPAEAVPVETPPVTAAETPPTE